jgi:hypothetical protein
MVGELFLIAVAHALKIILDYFKISCLNTNNAKSVLLMVDSFKDFQLTTFNI